MYVCNISAHIIDSWHTDACLSGAGSKKGERCAHLGPRQGDGKTYFHKTFSVFIWRCALFVLLSEFCFFKKRSLKCLWTVNCRDSNSISVCFTFSRNSFVQNWSVDSWIHVRFSFWLDLFFSGNHFPLYESTLKCFHRAWCFFLWERKFVGSYIGVMARFTNLGCRLLNCFCVTLSPNQLFWNVSSRMRFYNTITPYGLGVSFFGKYSFSGH